MVPDHEPPAAPPDADDAAKIAGLTGEEVACCFASLYHRLKRAASLRLRGVDDELMSTTDLLHAACLKLLGRGDAARPIRDEAHVVALAITAMRTVIIDRHRARRPRPEDIDDHLDRLVLEFDRGPWSVTDIDEAVRRLEADDPLLGRLAETRIFGGLTMPECAAVLRCSLSSAEKMWTLIKARLARDLR